MSAQKSIEKVAIIGAGGRIGGAFVNELLKTGKHTITALTRAGSDTKLPHGVKVAKVDYDVQEELVSALQGQEFLIITLSTTAPRDLQSRIIEAAGKAGVKYIMPNAYGMDVSDKKLIAESVYGKQCTDACEQVEAAGASWVVMACGFWYQWSVAVSEAAFGFNIKERRATFFDDGKTVINISTWPQCGRAVAALLSLPESGASPSLSEWKNKPLYIESFRASQRDMLDSIQRVTSTTDQDWDIRYEPSESRLKAGLEELKAGGREGYAKALYSRAMFPSVSGTYDDKMHNGVLGLPKENFDEASKEAVEMVESGWRP